MKRFTLCISTMVLVLFLTGCPPPQETARDAIATAYGYITSAQAQWGGACRADSTPLKCTTTKRLIDAQHVAIDALTVYCGGNPASGPTYNSGGPCVPQNSQLSTLQSAVMEMNNIVTNIKALMSGGS